MSFFNPSTNDLSSSSAAMLVHHRDFYLTGGDVVFLVQNSLFRVHKYFFERESSFFRRLLSQPVTPGQKRGGATDSNALVLEDVLSDDFSKFLWVFYNPKYSLYDTSVDDWVKILHLAHLWEFQEVKNLVARELNELDVPAVQKIVLYHTHDLDRRYLLPQYITMCLRNLREPYASFLTDQEGNSLGVNTVLRLFKIREGLLRGGDASEASVEELVKREFGLDEPEPEEEPPTPQQAQDPKSPVADLFTSVRAVATTRPTMDAPSTPAGKHDIQSRMSFPPTPAAKIDLQTPSVGINFSTFDFGSPIGTPVGNKTADTTPVPTLDINTNMGASNPFATTTTTTTNDDTKATESTDENATVVGDSTTDTPAGTDNAVSTDSPAVASAITNALDDAAANDSAAEGDDPWSKGPGGKKKNKKGGKK